MKYSLEYCKANKVAVKCETQEDWDILLIMSGTQTIKSFNSQFPCMGVGLTKRYSREEYYKSHGAEIITASEFVKSQKWCVKRTQETNPIIGTWFDKMSNNGCYSGWYDCSNWLHSHNFKNESIIAGGNLAASFANQEKHDGYHELTFEQFKKYILMENKKIIGYKPKEEFKPFVSKLHDLGDRGAIDMYCAFSNSYSIEGFRKAGVLDLWFEPVYESTKKTVTLRSKQGDFTVDVEPGKSIKYTDYDSLGAEKEFKICDLKAWANSSKGWKPVNGWEVKNETISIGCKHEIPIEDIQKVIDAYEK